MINVDVFTVVSEEQTITCEVYPLDGNFDKIQASGPIQFELTHVNSEPNIIIETEQWVHAAGYITVSTRPNNRLYLRITRKILLTFAHKFPLLFLNIK